MRLWPCALGLSCGAYFSALSHHQTETVLTYHVTMCYIVLGYHALELKSKIQNKVLYKSSEASKLVLNICLISLLITLSVMFWAWHKSQLRIQAISKKANFQGHSMHCTTGVLHKSRLGRTDKLIEWHDVPCGHNQNPLILAEGLFFFFFFYMK